MRAGLLHCNLDPHRVHATATTPVYAWGYGEDGRLGLGDVEESDVFEIGYDPVGN